MKPSIEVLGLSIKTFGLCFGAAFIVSGAMTARRLRELGRPPDWAYEMVFAALVGGLVGARGYWLLGHLSEVGDDPLGSIFGGSGLVWYGGLAGGAAGVLLWAWRKNMLNLELLDMNAPSLAMGYAIGRIGCQISGDGDYGKATDVPWGMAYPHGIVPTNEVVHPTPVYETLAMGLGAWLLWRLRDVFRPGALFAFYLVLVGAERFLVEFLRRNEPVLAGLTEAQITSLVILFAGVVWLARIARSGGLRAEPKPAPAPAARPATS
jgi:phosphatidylglycerol:prolipoprotein diacylglycerol transferase